MPKLRPISAPSVGRGVGAQQGVARGHRLRTDTTVVETNVHYSTDSEISRAAKCLTNSNQQRMQDSYQKLLALTRGVVRQAGEVLRR